MVVGVASSCRKKSDEELKAKVNIEEFKGGAEAAKFTIITPEGNKDAGVAKVTVDIHEKDIDIYTGTPAGDEYFMTISDYDKVKQGSTITVISKSGAEVKAKHYMWGKEMDEVAFKDVMIKLDVTEKDAVVSMTPAAANGEEYKFESKWNSDLPAVEKGQSQYKPSMLQLLAGKSTEAKVQKVMLGDTVSYAEKAVVSVGIMEEKPLLYLSYERKGVTEIFYLLENAKVTQDGDDIELDMPDENQEYVAVGWFMDGLQREPRALGEKDFEMEYDTKSGEFELTFSMGDHTEFIYTGKWNNKVAPIGEVATQLGEKEKK